MSFLNNKNKAITLLIVSALFFALMSTFVKLSGNIPSIEKSFFRNLVSFILSFYFIKKSKSCFLGKKENLKYLIGRALFGTIGLVANFYAIEHLILADANMLNQLSPFFVIIFSSIFLKEKIKKEQLLILCCAFLGSLFIIKPSFSFKVIPALIGILSAICAGGAYTFIRTLSNKEKGITIVFFFSCFSLITLFPFTIIFFKGFTILQLVYLLSAGICASIGQFSITSAYKLAPAKDISIYSYTQILFATFIGIILFNQIPTKLSLIGYIVVILSSILMFIYNNKNFKKEEVK